MKDVTEYTIERDTSRPFMLDVIFTRKKDWKGHPPLGKGDLVNNEVKLLDFTKHARGGTIMRQNSIEAYESY